MNVYTLNPNSTALPTVAPTPTATGGPVTVQTAGPYVYLACYVDNTNGRALSALENPESGAGNTVEVCAAACSGYKYMGVEYGGECYCDNVIGGGNGVATGMTPQTDGCSMVSPVHAEDVALLTICQTCSGNSSEYCGGQNRLNMYVLNPNATVATITTSTPTPTPGAPITVGNFGLWTYAGCYSEATNNRALSDLENPIPAANVSVQACGAACAAYLHFGVEYSGECTKFYIFESK